MASDGNTEDALSRTSAWAVAVVEDPASSQWIALDSESSESSKTGTGDELALRSSMSPSKTLMASEFGRRPSSFCRNQFSVQIKDA